MIQYLLIKTTALLNILWVCLGTGSTWFGLEDDRGLRLGKKEEEEKQKVQNCLTPNKNHNLCQTLTNVHAHKPPQKPSAAWCRR